MIKGKHPHFSLPPKTTHKQHQCPHSSAHRQGQGPCGFSSFSLLQMMLREMSDVLPSL
jgi:hypothetical protein